MTNQCLQRLMMDRTLKELPNDTAELFDAYVQEHPEVVAEMKEIEDSIQLATEALRANQPARSELPPLRIHPKAPLRRLRPILWTGPIGLAACLFLGFWLGRQAAVVNEPSGPSGQILVRRIEKLPEEFWSIRNFAERSESATAQPAIHWTSPLARPEIGDRS
jgi:anti-sigma factor RsiW